MLIKMCPMPSTDSSTLLYLNFFSRSYEKHLRKLNEIRSDLEQKKNYKKNLFDDSWMETKSKIT